MTATDHVPAAHEPEVPPTLDDLAFCFEGAVPAVIATSSLDGTPNVTYLTKVRKVDAQRVALSNQFFSKTARNLVENPRASVLLIDPRNYDQYRLHLRYERTDRRGPVFDRLRIDVDVAAALEGMQDVYRLRAADIYRVTHIDRLRSGRPPIGPAAAAGLTDGLDPGRIAELSGRLGRCGDLDTLVSTAMAGLAELFGHDHALLLLLDETGTQLFTIASQGFDTEGIGSEVRVGDGIIGLAAERCQPISVGNAIQVAKYSRRLRQAFEDAGDLTDARDIPVPGLPDAASRCAVPAMAMGQLIGVLAVESATPLAYGPGDEAVLGVVASLLASAIEAERGREREAEPDVVPAGAAPSAAGDTVAVRAYEVDGSVFVDGEYLIKGVAGRILTSLLRQHLAEGRVDFTSREVRLDPTLELPSFRDNFDSRLILLKRRLDERSAPLRIDKTGRGRFRLVLGRPVALDEVPAG